MTFQLKIGLVIPCISVVTLSLFLLAPHIITNFHLWTHADTNISTVSNMKTVKGNFELIDSDEFTGDAVPTVDDANIVERHS
jgi:hypothetical protein